jgi:hypothetical protein
MSKARPPKRKKEEYMPSDKIKDFCNEILEAGMHLASMSGVSLPNAENVSDAISCVLSIVEQYNLVGRWVTSHVSKCKKEYAMTKEIRQVSCFRFFFFINQYNAQSLTIGFLSDYSAGCYQLRGEVEQVFRDKTGCLEGCKQIWFATPVALQIGALP